MDTIRELGNVDVYVIDQLLKGAIRKDQRLLDAGCGSGRNFSYFANKNFNITGIDPKEEHIRNLQQKHPNLSHQLLHSSIEDFQPKKPFDYIICNAVLHFAHNHVHFEQLFERLVSFLEKDGILFIRMTSNHGMTELGKSDDGVYELPDQSTRYLITRGRLSQLCVKHNLVMEAPFKSVLVEDWRSMATMVLRKTV
ncbi:MAG: class I SAM-dependent methyltransferase [Crocinitomicaceae bacterium]